MHNNTERSLSSRSTSSYYVQQYREFVATGNFDLYYVQEASRSIRVAINTASSSLSTMYNNTDYTSSSTAS
ncbi:hypothetical protein EXIGLDRAFT_331196 [Exidia glandulosa HHB12029]|uniref:Uncharacterized protein n=1 Tax=Exidia glandulosa HHB12029 TaxID=1314781 RepID=A0A165CRG7_EXIGL|nr:hypothetical protein EXIGLDRAFT_331196 [Exidia glandulosa HHB12029]